MKPHVLKHENPPNPVGLYLPGRVPSPDLMSRNHSSGEDEEEQPEKAPRISMPMLPMMDQNLAVMTFMNNLQQMMAEASANGLSFPMQQMPLLSMPSDPNLQQREEAFHMSPLSESPMSGLNASVS